MYHTSAAMERNDKCILCRCECKDGVQEAVTSSIFMLLLAFGGFFRVEWLKNNVLLSANPESLQDAREIGNIYNYDRYSGLSPISGFDCLWSWSLGCH
jgi:hypothetical protein